MDTTYYYAFTDFGVYQNYSETRTAEPSALEEELYALERESERFEEDKEELWPWQYLCPEAHDEEETRPQSPAPFEGVVVHPFVLESTAPTATPSSPLPVAAGSSSRTRASPGAVAITCNYEGCATGKMFPSRSAFIAHLKDDHHLERSGPCYWCEDDTQVGELLRHIAEKHSGTKLMCIACGSLLTRGDARHKSRCEFSAREGYKEVMES